VGCGTRRGIRPSCSPCRHARAATFVVPQSCCVITVVCTRAHAASANGRHGLCRANTSPRTAGTTIVGGMNELFGLLGWQLMLALFAPALWFQSTRRVLSSADIKGVRLGAWILLLGAVLGSLPVMLLSPLLSGLDVALFVALPSLTIGFCARILRKFACQPIQRQKDE
jgi:hypothetical protein